MVNWRSAARRAAAPRSRSRTGSHSRGWSASRCRSCCWPATRTCPRRPRVEDVCRAHWTRGDRRRPRTGHSIYWEQPDFNARAALRQQTLGVSDENTDSHAGFMTASRRPRSQTPPTSRSSAQRRARRRRRALPQFEKDDRPQGVISFEPSTQIKKDRRWRAVRRGCHDDDAHRRSDQARKAVV